MDEEFNLESTKGKKKARMGRRANEEEDSAGGTTADGGAAPKRRGGWGDEPPRTAGSGGRRADDELGDDKFREKRFSDSDGAAAIPELKEEAPVASSVNEPPEMAKAPSIAVNRVATYRELDFDLNRHASFATLEPDEYWDWDRLFAEVTGDLLVDTGDQDVGPVAPPTAASGSASDEATATAVPVK
uniref:AGC-kinase C-terminal domain-containing protein n=1 Tax=Macrostomum lignano TaxID=282301 RepID=A0A1I8I3I5_9PLAT